MHAFLCLRTRSSLIQVMAFDFLVPNQKWPNVAVNWMLRNKFSEILCKIKKKFFAENAFENAGTKCLANLFKPQHVLTHWGQVTHICVSKLNSIGSNNGLSPGQRQAIIWTNTGIFSICTLGTNFSEILSKIHTFSVTKMHLKTSSVKWRQFCLRLNVLRHVSWVNSLLLSEYHFHGLVQKYYMSSTLQGIDIWHFSKKSSNCQANRAKLPFNTLRLRQNGHHFLMHFLEWKWLNSD